MPRSVTEDRLDARIARREAEAARQKQMPKPQPQPPKPTPAPAPAVKHDTVQISDKGRAAYEQSKQVKPAVVPPRDEYRQQQKADLKYVDRPLLKHDTVEISVAARKTHQEAFNRGTMPTKKAIVDPVGHIYARAADQGGAPDGGKTSGGGSGKDTSNPQLQKIKDPDFTVNRPEDKRIDKVKDPDFKPATEKTWGQAAAEAAIAAQIGEIGSNAAKSGAQKFIQDPQAIPKIGVAGNILISSVDIYYGVSENLSQGKTNFGSNKSIPQAVAEAGTGAVIQGGGALVTTGALTAAGVSSGGTALAASAVAYGLGVVDAKAGLSAAVGEAVQAENKRIKEVGKNIKEYIDRDKLKGYGDMTDKEKREIDRRMKNIAEQNDRILKAKEKWLEADKKGDVAAKKAAEKEAKDAREKGGTISRDHDVERVKELNEKIKEAKEKWKEADKIKDPVARQKAKDAAHDEANRYRSEGGTLI
jgi:hypothetical protein